MKALPPSLLCIALAAAGNAPAQDAHGSHHGHETAMAMGPQATPPAADAGEATPPDPGDGHAPVHMPPVPPPTHEGHAPGSKAEADTHDAHGMHGDHAAPAAPADPHAGHWPAPPADGAAPHAAHAGHGQHEANAVQVPREPIPGLTRDDLAAAFPPLQPHAMEHAPGFNSLVLFDQLEAWNNAHGSGQAWAAKGWFGGDIDRLWLRSEGERMDGRLDAWSLDALYGHAISPWWDAVAGVRHDGGSTPGLTRAAIGVQGLAPYKFEFAATAYLGGPRRAELVVETEYSLLLSNRLILQPTFEARLAAEDDRRRGVGNGPGQVETGLRLRYEINRRLAPYIGFVHERRFGASVDPHDGEGTRDSRWVAGVRFWF